MLKLLIKHRIKSAIAGAGLVVMLAGLVLFLSLRPGEEAIDVFVTGEAEAVATTRAEVLDGLWEPTRFWDELYYPMGLAINGNYLVVADFMCDRIQILDGAGNQRIGRPGQYGFSYYDSGALIDGYRENALFMKPSGVSISPAGDIIVSDSGNHVVRRIDDEFVITIAGSGESGFADGREGGAQFNFPRAAVMCPQGYIYVADTMNHALRRIDPAGNVTLFSGQPGESGFADGALGDALFFEPSGLELTEDGVLYVADSANHAIRRIERGNVSTVAGQPGEITDTRTGYSEGAFVDGANSEARFNFPRDIARMPDGSLIVADSLNHAVRMITPDDTRTLIGGGMAGAFHASAENMSLSRPEGVATDGETLFISDTINNRVLSVPLTERVLAGRPSRGQMLAETGLSVDARFAYRGDIRVFLGGERVDMGRVQPWNTPEAIYVPIRPFLEALGARVELNERTGTLYITIADTVTVLTLDRDYFILRGVMVTTLDEIMRLFPYTLEWFPDLSLITLHIPFDLRGQAQGGRSIHV